jgi:AsmA protein
MKAIKYLLIGLGGLAVLVVAAGAIFAMTFDPNRYRGQIEAAVKERTGRTLKLQGPLELSFYPGLGGKVAGVTLTERAAEQEFLSLDSARATVALMALLRGEVIVDKVYVSGLKANVVKDKNGRFNFDDLLEPKDAKGKPPAPQKPAPEGKEAAKFDIAGVTIERSSVFYRDLAEGKDLAISDLKLSTGRIAERADGKLELQAGVKGKNPAMDAKVDVSGHYKIDLAAKAYALEKLDAKVTGLVAGMRDAKLTAKGDVSVDPAKSEYRAKGLAVELSGAQEKQKLEAKLAAPEIVVSNDQAKGGAIMAELKIKGDNRSTEANL